MPTKEEKLIQSLVDFVDNSIEEFDKKIPGFQRTAFNEIELLLKELDVKDKKVLPSNKNVRILARLKRELQKIIISPEYKDAVKEFLKTYEKVDEIQQQYFSTINNKFSPSAAFREVKSLLIDEIRNDLLGSGVQANIVDKGMSILLNSMSTSKGVLFSTMKEEMRSFLLNDKQSEGSLARYAHQKAFDNLQKYNRKYAQFASDDLGLVFYQYVGPLKKTSREFCVKMIAAKNNGCMKYIHESQFPELLEGHICGEQCHINPTTKLPDGFYDNTTVLNFKDLAGGYGCAHQFMPISTVLVDKATREKFGV